MSLAQPVPTTSSGNPYIDGLLTENHWADDRPGSSTPIAFYVVGDDGRSEPFRFGLDDVSATTNTAEEAAFRSSLQLISNVCGLSFTEVGRQEEADLLLGAGSAPGFAGALGFASTPGGEATGVKINSDNLATDDGSSLRQGGYDFITVLHEVGHALGLKHPFSDDPFPPFPGVTASSGDYGDNALNQGVYTVMSYDDGFPRRDGPGDTSVNEGWSGTPMAFDVAALQYLYGANTTHKTGNDTYALPTGGGAGGFYSCLWDAGGTDTIATTGGADATIDLRSATLKNAPGGGGWLSAQEGVKGGFTIAKGAQIENAQGGAGDDRLIGNAAKNDLRGGAGADELVGGAGQDRLWGGTGADRFVFASAAESAAGVGDVIEDFAGGSDEVDLSGVDANAGRTGNQAFRLDDGGAFVAGELRQDRDRGGLILRANVDGDGDPELAIRLPSVQGLLSTDDFVL